MTREKKTFSGSLLEVDFFPVFSDGRKMSCRAPKTKPSSKEQKKYNKITATKKLIRLVNANFDNTDYLLHPTYAPAEAPQDEKKARRDLINFLRRVKTKRAAEVKKIRGDLIKLEKAIAQSPQNEFLQETAASLKAELNKLEEPFRYIYVIEKQVYKTGIFANSVNWHFHLFITGGIPPRILESMWPKGIRTNCNNYQPDRFGPEAAARYMSKDPQGSKRFSYSRNLKKPVEKIKDGKITGKAVERMARLRIDDRQYWEKRYPGYRFVRCFARFNEFNCRWYVSAILYRTDGEAPKWEEDEWITEDF